MKASGLVAWVLGIAVVASGAGVVAQTPAPTTGEGGKTQASKEGAGQRAGFDVFLMGVVTKTNYDATPVSVRMKVIEGALERLGQEVDIIIETEEAIKHFKKRVKVGVELDTRVRVGTDGKLYMATSQRRGIPSREFKGGPSIEESVKKLLESGG
jgi:hypothetical protein